MHPGDLMRRLDQRVLPPLGRVLHRLGRGAARIRLLTLTAVVGATAVLIAAVWAADRTPSSDPTLGQVVNVGVGQGQSIPAYVQASRTELAALLASPAAGTGPGETYALVTLTAYLAPDRLTPVLGGVAVAEVFARVPLPDTQTEIVRIAAYRVPADVTTGMADVAARKAEQATTYERLATKLTRDTPAERELRAVYASNARVAAAEATAYRDRCSCVYAAVVRATPAALERISERTEARAVDPAPEVRRLDRAVFLPPLPEQSDVVHAPPDTVVGPTPSGGPAGPGPVPTAPEPAPSPSPSTAPEPSLPPPAPPPPTPESTPASVPVSGLSFRRVTGGRAGHRVRASPSASGVGSRREAAV